VRRLTHARGGAARLTYRAPRALPLGSPRWRRIRLLVIGAQPICPCGELANECDHIDGDAANNDIRNLQALCKACHSRKTAREVGLHAPR